MTKEQFKKKKERKTKEQTEFILIHSLLCQIHLKRRALSEETAANPYSLSHTAVTESNPWHPAYTYAGNEPLCPRACFSLSEDMED